MDRKTRLLWPLASALAPALILAIGLWAADAKSEITHRAAETPVAAQEAAVPAEAPRETPRETPHDSVKPTPPTVKAPITGGAADLRTAALDDAALRVQCWQEGVKIIDEDNLYGIRLRNLIKGDTLGLRGRDAQNGEVYIVPVSDATCLIRPMR